MNKKKPLSVYLIRAFIKVASTYSPTLKRAVPSALTGLTSLFGMGRGGPRCNRHLKRVIDRFQIIRLQIYNLQFVIYQSVINVLKDLDELAIEVIRRSYYKSTGN